MATTTRKRKHSTDGSATIMQGLHETGAAARQLAAERFEEVRDRAEQYVDEGRARMRHAADRFQDRVQERPLKSLLIAAGVGFLLGAVWMRR